MRGRAAQGRHNGRPSRAAGSCGENTESPAPSDRAWVAPRTSRCRPTETISRCWRRLQSDTVIVSRCQRLDTCVLSVCRQDGGIGCRDGGRALHAHRKVPRCVSERLRLTVKTQSPLRAARWRYRIKKKEKHIDHPHGWRHVTTSARYERYDRTTNDRCRYTGIPHGRCSGAGRRRNARRCAQSSVDSTDCHGVTQTETCGGKSHVLPHCIMRPVDIQFS